MSAWRAIEGEPLLTFVRGKTVASMTVDWDGGATTVFTDGSAIRCSALDGTVYSSYSADSATVEWEATDSYAEEGS